MREPGQQFHADKRKGRAAQRGKKRDPGDVSSGRQPGDLHLDEIKLVVNRVEVTARRVGLARAQAVLGWPGHVEVMQPTYATGKPLNGKGRDAVA